MFVVGTIIFVLSFVLSYSLPKFTNTLDDLTIDKDKTYIEVLGDDDAFVKINISLNCRDFEDKDLSFSITAPVAYPLS